MLKILIIATMLYLGVILIHIISIWRFQIEIPPNSWKDSYINNQLYDFLANKGPDFKDRYISEI